MELKTIRNALGLAVAVVVLAGCSSNKNADNSGANANSAPVDTSSSYSSGMDTGAGDLAGLTRVYYFDFDKADLRPDSQAALDRSIAVLRNGSQRIRLEGNGDERGTREYNMALGERRANAVANYMVVNGVSRDRLETVSYGEEKPAAPGHDESAWSQNRRVELQLN
ncbi:MAG: peptidoglycan-associated lipoprotein Pal [Spongiibacteraceae bacterium]